MRNSDRTTYSIFMLITTHNYHISTMKEYAYMSFCLYVPAYLPNIHRRQFKYTLMYIYLYWHDLELSINTLIGGFIDQFISVIYSAKTKQSIKQHQNKTSLIKFWLFNKPTNKLYRTIPPSSRLVYCDTYDDTVSELLSTVVNSVCSLSTEIACLVSPIVLCLKTTH